MKKLYVEKQDVEYKTAYMVFGFFVYVCTVFTCIFIWDDIFFDRSKWLTRKNILEYLKTHKNIKIEKIYKSFAFKLEDGSEIYIREGAKEKDWYSYHMGSECLFVGGHAGDLLCKSVDREILEILRGRLNEKSI
jgi:hypothetical protein